MFSVPLQPLANHLWQSTLFAGVAWLMTLALRKNGAHVRYWVWLAASLKFALPFAALIWVGAHAGVHLNHPTPAATALSPLPFRAGQVSVPVAVATTQALRAPPRAHLFPSLNWTLLAGIVWFCGIAFIAFIWWRKWRTVRAHLRHARPLALPFPIHAASSPAVFEPGVFGLWRPVLMLPAGLEKRLEPPQLEALVAHELCHVRRRDNLASAFHMLIEAMFWFHPLTWWIGARLVHERERACDEAVLRAGVAPRAYAAGILKVCENYLRTPLECMAGVAGANLKDRIDAIMTHAPARQLRRSTTLLLIAAAGAAAAVPIVVGMQSPATQPTFEVATVKPDDPNDRVVGLRELDPGGRVVYRAYTLRQLIQEAYGLQQYQLSGGPAWTESERFNIEAKPPADSAAARVMPSDPKTTPPPDELLMLRSLLEARFRLALSKEQHEGTVYRLDPVAGGIKRSEFQPPAHPDERPLITMGREEDPTQEGINYNFTGHNATLAMLAARLEQQLGAPVEDNTGLSGSFDFVVHFAKDDSASAKYPTMPQALQSELGLKFQAGKGPVDHYVISHAELPTSENVGMQPPATRPRFEVTSVKLDRSATGRNSMDRSPGGDLSATNVTLKMLIETAFSVHEYQLIGAPGWLDSERYDVAAKAPPNTVGNQIGPMLEALLADRFNLKVHRETSQMSVYALVVAKDGPKFQAIEADARVGDGVSKKGRGHLTAQKVPLSDLVEILSDELGLSVIDRTGLKGRYDLNLQWTPDESQPKALGDSEAARASAPAQSPGGPSLFTAVQEQLGLKLEPARGLVDVLAVDHVEKASAN